MAIELNLSEIYTFNGAMNDPITEGAIKGRGVLEKGSRQLAYLFDGGVLRYSVNVAPNTSGLVRVHLSKDWVDEDPFGMNDDIHNEWQKDFNFKSPFLAQQFFHEQDIYGQMEKWMARGLGVAAGLNLFDGRKDIAQKSVELAALGAGASILYLRGDNRMKNYRHFAHLMWPAVNKLDTQPSWASYPKE